MFGSLFGTAFLVGAAVSLMTSGTGWSGKILGLSCLVVLGVLYSVVSPMTMGRAWRARAAVLAAQVAIVIPVVAAGWPDAVTLWLYAAITGGMLLRMREALLLAIGLAVAMLVVDQAAGHGMPFEITFVLVALTAWMGAFAGNIALAQELRRTRQALADAAVANERIRIGRDLHDILGHSLTAITVKAGLAGRLVDRDPAAARREIAEIEGLARQSVGDVRATAAGYRDTSLVGEIAVAGSVLQAAGFLAELPTAVDDVSPAARSVFGYVVRESVTNTVRHSGGTWCAITLTPESVTIVDNGTGPGRRTGVERRARIGPGQLGGAGGTGRRHLGGRTAATRRFPGARDHPGRRFIRPVRAAPGIRVPDARPRREGPAGAGFDRSVIKVLVADDQAMIRGAFVALLSLESDLEVVAQVGAGDDVVPAALRTRPDVALLDVQMPGLDGIAACTALVGQLPGCRVMILTTFGRPGYLRRAMEAGAVGFVTKDAPAEQLIDGIRRVAAGLRVVDPVLAAESLSLGESPLTGRERDVLTAATDGATVAELARRLYLSEGTVRNHLSSVIAKTGARTRADAVRIATERGWL